VHITPEMMEASYELLRTTLPFRRWKLPHADQIDFAVLVTRERFGHYRAYKDGTGHEIAVSTKVKTLHMMTEVIAHEMVHLRQELLRHRDNHGKHFKRLASLVCRRHGWNLATF
jgi:hypothetical protein